MGSSHSLGNSRNLAKSVVVFLLRSAVVRLLFARFCLLYFDPKRTPADALHGKARP
jgi:hypothetical protein